MSDAAEKVKFNVGGKHFEVSRALIDSHAESVLVVYDPAKDEMFWAEKGAGAWLNDNRRLRVSGRRSMAEAVFATGVPFGAKKTLPAMLADLARLMPACAGVRRWGAASLDLAFVAAGRFDGFWESALSPWDTAAGCLLVREAGGFVTNFKGQSETICADQVLAGNDALHSKLHKLIATALK